MNESSYVYITTEANKKYTCGSSDKIKLNGYYILDHMKLKIGSWITNQKILEAKGTKKP